MEERACGRSMSQESRDKVSHAQLAKIFDGTHHFLTNNPVNSIPELREKTNNRLRETHQEMVQNGTHNFLGPTALTAKLIEFLQKTDIITTADIEELGYIQKYFFRRLRDLKYTFEIHRTDGTIDSGGTYNRKPINYIKLLRSVYV
jgi:hypothetical protein